MQHLRDLEREGVVPPVARTSSGYRSWAHVHVLSAVAYRELAQGVGPARARELLRALHRQPAAAFLALLDDAHADVARERRDLRLAREAVADIAVEPATLRHREAQGLLAPHRTGHGLVRTCSPVQVRDARVIHQLRTAGYGIPALREVLGLLLDPQDATTTVRAAAALHDLLAADRPVNGDAEPHRNLP